MDNEYRRTFENVFVLDSSKLSRLLNVIEERFKELSESIFVNYEVSTKNGKNFKTVEIDEILRHDNSVHNPLVNFEITYQDKRENPENRCYIEYDRENSEIYVKIETKKPREGNELFAEIEEQIERSFVTNWVYTLKEYAFTFILILIMLPIMVAPILNTSSKIDPKKYEYLSEEDVIQLSGTITNKEISRENKIDFLYEYHSKKLENIKKWHC